MQHRVPLINYHTHTHTHERWRLHGRHTRAQHKSCYGLSWKQNISLNESLCHPHLHSQAFLPTFLPFNPPPLRMQTFPSAPWITVCDPAKMKTILIQARYPPSPLCSRPLPATSTGWIRSKPTVPGNAFHVTVKLPFRQQWFINASQGSLFFPSVWCFFHRAHIMDS